MAVPRHPFCELNCGMSLEWVTCGGCRPIVSEQVARQRSRAGIGGFHMRTKALTLCASVAVILGGVGAAPAFADERGSADPAPQAQRAAEQQLVRFREAKPEPRPPAQSASQEAWNAYWTKMYDWWQEVPWDAVSEQWGCEQGVTEVELVTAADGAITAQYSGNAHCPVDLPQEAAGRVGIPEPRALHESMRTSDAVALASVQTCDLPGGNDHCLTRPYSGSATLTASFRYFQSGNITGRARLGHSSQTSCTQGTQLALGTLGTGTYGSTWYATGSAAFSARFSSSFIVGTSTVYSRFCAVM